MSPSVPVREPLPCFADEGTPAGSAVGLQLEANRVSGVAPLAVFFDTVGTTSSATQRPFLELGYCWDFGDPDSGSFTTTTGLTRAQAKGPVASHVFEKPGNYTVTVSARDREGRVATRALQIAVADPNTVFAGEATTCFSSSGDFTGCPAGAAHETISSFDGLNAHVATGKRLLLRRGDTFMSGKVSVNVPGPGSIGAYGSGERPRILLGTSAVEVSGTDPNFNDWRVADLNFEGMSADANVLVVEGRASELLVLRVRGTNIGQGIGAGISTIDNLNANGFPGHDVIDGLFIQDSEFTDVLGGAGATLGFISAHRLVMLGNIWRNSLRGEHVLRTTWVDRGVFSNNDMGEAPAAKTVWKLHAPDWEGNSVGAGKYSERIVISDNVFRSTGPHDWTVVIGPQNNGRDERIRQLVIERNLFLPGPDALISLTVSAQDVVIRDNIVNHTRGRCFSVGQTGIEPPPARVWLTNNTCYSRAPGALEFVEIGPGLNTIVAANNLLSGVDAAEGAFPASAATEATANAALPPSVFVGGSFDTDWKSFQLAPGAAAIDAGRAETASPWDFSGRPRASDGDGSGSAEPDLGALEFVR